MRRLGLLLTLLIAIAVPVGADVVSTSSSTSSGGGGAVTVTDTVDTALVSATGGGSLQVECTSGCGGSGGASTADGAAHIAGTTQGTAAQGVFDDAAPGTLAEDKVGTIRATASRAWHVNLRNASGTEVSFLTDTQLRATAVPVSLASVPSHAVTNAGTFATQSAATQSGTWTVQPGNTANTTAWKVDGSAVTQPVSLASVPSHAVTNAGTFATQSAASQTGTWTVQPGNTPNTSPWLASIHDGTTKAAVFNLAANDPLSVAIVDGSGNQITSFGGTGGTAAVDNAAFTPGTTNFTPIGGEVDDTATSAATENSAAAARMTVQRALHVNLRDNSGAELAVGGGTQYDEDTVSTAADKLNMAGVVRKDTAAALATTDGDRTQLEVDASGRLWTNPSSVTQPVSAASLPLPTGASTLAEQQTQTTSLALIDNLPVAQGSTTSGQSGALVQGAVTTAAPTYTTAQTAPLSLTTAGGLRVDATITAVTAVGQVDDAAFTVATSEVTPIGGCVTSDSADSGDAGCLAMTAARALITSTTIAAALPAGTANIGDVDILTLPALVAGTANIGDVDVLTLPALVAGTANIGDVDVLTLPALVAGTANIGDVDVLTLPALPAGTNNIGDVDILSFPDNEPINVAQMNGVTVLMGNGASGTGAQRFTLANDSTGQVALAAGSALVGQIATAGTATTTNSNLECYITSAASTNATNCKASAGNIYGYDLVNTTSTLYYLRMYNLASAPTCSSATGFIRSIPIPHGTGTGAGLVADYSTPVGYTTGIGFCLTLNGASTDNNAAATGVYVTIRYK